MKRGLFLTLILSGLAAQAVADKKPWELEWVGTARQAANNCVAFKQNFSGASCELVVRGEQGFDVQIRTSREEQDEVNAGMRIADDLCAGMQMRVALVIHYRAGPRTLAAFLPPQCGSTEAAKKPAIKS